jgi:hypothetical protein
MFRFISILTENSFFLYQKYPISNCIKVYRFIMNNSTRLNYTSKRKKKYDS